MSQVVGEKKKLSQLSEDMDGEEDVSLEELRQMMRKRRALRLELSGEASEVETDDAKRAGKVQQRLASKLSKRKATDGATTDGYETDEDELEKELSDKAPKKTKKDKAAEVETETLPEDEEEVHNHDAVAVEKSLSEKWASQRKARKAAALKALIEAEREPLPQARMFLVESAEEGSKNSLAAARLHLLKHPQDDLAFRLGTERPIYVVFQLKKPHAFLAHLAVLDTGGEYKMDQLRKMGFMEDLFQLNKPRKATPRTPLIGSNKAMLSMADLEHLRRLGPALLERGKELSKMALAKARYVTLGPKLENGEDEEGGNAVSNDLPPTRILLHKDERGDYVYQFYRVSPASNGGSIESNARFTLWQEEVEALMGWLENIFEEAHRLTSSRIAVTQPLTPELRVIFSHSLLALLVEKVHTEGVDVSAGADPEILYDFVARLIRGTSSIQLKRDINCMRGSREIFQAYHLDLCRSSQLEAMVARVRSTIRNSHSA